MFEPLLESYGYGWSIRQLPIGPEEATRTVIAHGGGINGFNTVIARVMDDRHLVVLLNNTGDARLGEMQNGILDLVYGREPTPPKPSVVQALTETVATGGVTAAVARYRGRQGTARRGVRIRRGPAQRPRLPAPECGRRGRCHRGVHPQCRDVPGGLQSLRQPRQGTPWLPGRTEEAIVNYARSLKASTPETTGR